MKIPSILDGRQFLVDVDQLEIDDISYLLHSAEQILSMNAPRAWRPLTGFRCTLLFAQPFTPTFSSFSFAAQSMGMSVTYAQDPATELASEEPISDAIMAFVRNTDLLIVENEKVKICDRLCGYINQNVIECRVIAANNGIEEPTQALCDLLVVNRYHDLSVPKARKVAFVGNFTRMRSDLSFSRLLAKWRNWQQIFCALGESEGSSELIGALADQSTAIRFIETFEDIPEDVDVIYLMKNGKDQYNKMPSLTAQTMNRFKKTTIVLHPLPRKAELPYQFDRHSSAKNWEAVECSQAIRRALIAWMFGDRVPSY